MAWALVSRVRRNLPEVPIVTATTASDAYRSVDGAGAEGGTMGGWLSLFEHPGPLQGRTGGREGHFVPGGQCDVRRFFSFFSWTCEPHVDALAAPVDSSAKTTASASGVARGRSRPGFFFGARTVYIPNIDERKDVFHSYPG
jgi:hypothetical protein